MDYLYEVYYEHNMPLFRLSQQNREGVKKCWVSQQPHYGLTELSWVGEKK